MPHKGYRQTEEHREKSRSTLAQFRSAEHLDRACEAARAAKREKAKENNAGVYCKWCQSGTVIRLGTNSRCRPPRKRYKCKSCGRHFLESKAFPFGRKFNSPPSKLLAALNLMKSGLYSLQGIADIVVLDRYTIYKLHNHVGRGFSCVCGRVLGHVGWCKPRFDRSPLAQHHFYSVGPGDRTKRNPNWFAVRTLESQLKKVIQQVKEQEDAERKERRRKREHSISPDGR